MKFELPDAGFEPLSGDEISIVRSFDVRISDSVRLIACRFDQAKEMLLSELVARAESGHVLEGSIAEFRGWVACSTIRELNLEIGLPEAPLVNQKFSVAKTDGKWALLPLESA